jgi:hypothetical protein
MVRSTNHRQTPKPWSSVPRLGNTGSMPSHRNSMRNDSSSKALSATTIAGFRLDRLQVECSGIWQLAVEITPTNTATALAASNATHQLEPL